MKMGVRGRYFRPFIPLDWSIHQRRPSISQEMHGDPGFGGHSLDWFFQTVLPDFLNRSHDRSKLTNPNKKIENAVDETVVSFPYDDQPRRLTVTKTGFDYHAECVHG